MTTAEMFAFGRTVYFYGVKNCGSRTLNCLLEGTGLEVCLTVGAKTLCIKAFSSKCSER